MALPGKHRRQAQQKNAAPHGRKPVTRQAPNLAPSDRRSRSLPRLRRALARVRRCPRVITPLPSAASPHRHRVLTTRCSGGEEARLLLFPNNGAQRASSWSIRLTVIAIAIALVALAGAANPTPAAAAGMKVVIVVGPAGSNTANYKDNARRYAAQARSYGATWSRSTARMRHGRGSRRRPRARRS